MLWKEHRVQTIVYSCLGSQGTAFASSNHLRLSVHPTVLRVAIQRELRNWCLFLEQALPTWADEDFILSGAGVRVSCLKAARSPPRSAASSLCSWSSVSSDFELVKNRSPRQQLKFLDMTLLKLWQCWVIRLPSSGVVLSPRFGVGEEAASSQGSFPSGLVLFCCGNRFKLVHGSWHHQENTGWFCCALCIVKCSALPINNCKKSPLRCGLGGGKD